MITETLLSEFFVVYDNFILIYLGGLKHGKTNHKNRGRGKGDLRKSILWTSQSRQNVIMPFVVCYLWNLCKRLLNFFDNPSAGCACFQKV